jgi:hypothetical protein
MERVEIDTLAKLLVRSSAEGCPKMFDAVIKGTKVGLVVVKGDDVEKVKAFLETLRA